ncbi:MAG: hypothetical protein A2V77_09385 [Anaeromyxobacter sp. RBG_16_69_14]|nr:MAG: hypothetical protein A2V77_09385 [Anaeromyxobacter sp. RBG_16_69_14]
MSGLRLLRIVLVVALGAFASGLPHVVSAALGADECAGECDGGVDPHHCTPNCSQGACACAKVFPSFAAPSQGIDNPLDTPPGAVGPDVGAAPVLPLVLSGVFHPPQS